MFLSKSRVFRASSLRAHALLPSPARTRWLHDYTAKYADKLHRIAEEQGTTVEALRVKLQQEQLAKRKASAAAALSSETSSSSSANQPLSSNGASTPRPKVASERKDSSPIKPLSDYFNLAKLLATPHTPAQIQALWTAYHASRSHGTGRGFLCATLPTETYEKMLACAVKYPAFVLPLPRAVPTEDDAAEQAHEFFFMQWGQHGAPATPTYASVTALLPTSPPASAPPNPQTSTVLFTPLGEYKLRQSFSTPYLVLTFYADLARSHGVVLLRGEITPGSAAAPSASADDMRWMLAQADAQMLAMGVQKFYLWEEQGGRGEALLRTFHERPAEFKWEELLEVAKLTS